MKLPRITGFDGSTIITAEGAFSVRPIHYADGGKSPRLSEERFREIATFLLECYADAVGQTVDELAHMQWEDRHKYCHDGRHDGSCSDRTDVAPRESAGWYWRRPA